MVMYKYHGSFLKNENQNKSIFTVLHLNPHGMLPKCELDHLKRKKHKHTWTLKLMQNAIQRGYGLKT